MRAAASIALAAVLQAGASRAAPTVDVLATPRADQPGCAWIAKDASPAAGSTVLLWSGNEATMSIDGQPVTFTVREAPCRRDCVAPGRRGVRVFRLAADTARATLTKRVLCPRDAQVCSGLPAGDASLQLTTPRGVRRMTVRNDDCDPW